MASLNKYLDDVVEGFREILEADCVDVDKHPGQFTEDELKIIARNKKAVRISMIDFENVDVQGNTTAVYSLRMAAFIICEDSRGSNRDDLARDVLELIVRALPFKKWNSDSHYQSILPKSITASSIYGTETEKKGVSIWAVSWSQQIKVT